MSMMGRAGSAALMMVEPVRNTHGFSGYYAVMADLAGITPPAQVNFIGSGFRKSGETRLRFV